MSPVTKKLPAEAYTIGWVSTSKLEKAAALALLDEVHADLECVHGPDANSYTLGRMGRHNVVICVLPDGEMGTDTVAVMARDMMHTFLNIHYGLLVGTAGGVPSAKHDIRLGDVVVSTADGIRSEPGVVQFDFGRMVQNQDYLLTRVLNQPPLILRNAITSLDFHYDQRGNDIKDKLLETLSRNERLQKTHGPPDPTTDRLFQSNNVHPFNADSTSGQDYCDLICVNNGPNITRPPRDEGEDDPVVHPGLIASGNSIVHNAIVRDELAARKDVLCFETEAAGLMNIFPCLVIRGISHYADSHANDIWEGYAALTAAIYAKEVLSQVNPSRSFLSTDS